MIVTSSIGMQRWIYKLKEETQKRVDSEWSESCILKISISFQTPRYACLQFCLTEAEAARRLRTNIHYRVNTRRKLSFVRRSRPSDLHLTELML